MKGILKIYHPEETLKYNIKNTYCKAVYSNQQHFLEVEVITDESLDHVDDDSLQYNYPQLAFKIYDFPIESDEISGKTINVDDTVDEIYTEADLYCDDDAVLYGSELIFSDDEQGDLQVIWKGEIDDFYTGSDTPLPFRLKCSLKPDEILIDEE
jgi:hypothetical protein